MGVSGESLQRALRAVFVGEAADSLARVEALLVGPPPAPVDGAVVESLFREFHTMKVGAAAAGFGTAARALHEAEGMLEAARNAAAGLPAGDHLDALRALVAQVRGEVGTPLAPDDGPTPLTALWPLLARATAEAAAHERKFAALVTTGGAVAVGAAQRGALCGALLHLVRNAVAHGIEPPAARVAAGKSRVGCVAVEVEAGDGVLLISVADDGRGLDRAAIAAAAGDAESAERAVLRAGVSTRTGADVLAGRGVGLDAVAHTVAALGGDLAVESRDGHGCTVRLILPT
jgi:chemotaxis protein histidine kinase CheA